MRNPEKLETLGRQDTRRRKKKKKTKKQTKTQHNTICVGHRYAQTNTNNLNKTQD